MFGYQEFQRARRDRVAQRTQRQIEKYNTIEEFSDETSPN